MNDKIKNDIKRRTFKGQREYLGFSEDNHFSSCLPSQLESLNNFLPKSNMAGNSICAVRTFIDRFLIRLSGQLKVKKAYFPQATGSESEKFNGGLKFLERTYSESKHDGRRKILS